MKKTMPVSCLFLCFLLQMTAFGYQTRNVFIIVIDGARYSETFGDSAHRYVPRIWNELRPFGTIYTRFYNDNMTVTCPGHATIVTGAWQNISNDGSMRPQTPTMFEYFRKELGTSANESYVILGKYKLDILAYSNLRDYGSAYGASVSYCDYYTDDRETWKNIQNILSTRHPRLAITNLGQVDAIAHGDDWPGYLASIQQADSIVGLVWNLLQTDPFYKDSSTLFVVNDHGRHTDYFASHGDNCEGCRHIMCMMIGPDAKGNEVDSAYRQQIDIAPTIGELLEFSTPFATGHSLIPVRVPAAPILTLPPNGAVDQPLILSLQWQPVHRSSSYSLQVAQSPDFLHPIIDDSTLTGTSKSVYLSSSTTYYWRVNARNSGGPGEWSEVRSFVTGSVLPPEVVLLLPKNAATIAVDSVTMVWSASTSDVPRYWLEIATDSLMKNITIVDSSLLKTERSYKSSRNKTTYWWRVRAYTPGGWADWSEKRSFRVDIPVINEMPKYNDCSFKKVLKAGKFIDITYALRDPSAVTITISSLQGRRIKFLLESYQKPGFYTKRLNLSTLSGGCYVLAFKTSEFSRKKMTVIF